MLCRSSSSDNTQAEAIEAWSLGTFTFTQDASTACESLASLALATAKAHSVSSTEGLAASRFSLPFGDELSLSRQLKKALETVSSWPRLYSRSSSSSILFAFNLAIVCSTKSSRLALRMIRKFSQDRSLLIYWFR